MNALIQPGAELDLDAFVQLRRDIHQAPELGGDTPSLPSGWPAGSKPGATRCIAALAATAWSAYCVVAKVAGAWACGPTWMPCPCGRRTA